MSVVFTATIMLVDLFVAITQVTVSVAIMQLEVSAANMWLTLFIEIMWEPVAVVQVVSSTVHYAHDDFYCNYAGDFLLDYHFS